MPFTYRSLHRIVLLASLTAFAPTTSRALDFETPVGRWQTYDERTHAPRGFVLIFEQEGKLFGRIERVPEKRSPRDVCEVCTDERHDQPIDGLVIIRNMQRSVQDPLEWDGGDVLDPDSGRLYRFKMRVEDRGTRLVVRGFFGVSVLGRSQTWRRVL